MRPDAVIVAVGDFPRSGGEAYALLENAPHVVCCDSAADTYRRRFGREPDVVVGDLDSVRGRFANVVRICEQQTNDLEKAIRYCRARGWRKLIVLGATGRREDHTLGNVFRALALGVEIVSDYGRFVPFCGRLSLALAKGTPISLFAPDVATRMTSKGLEWSLDGVRFENLYCATLNRTSATRVTLHSTRPALVYIAFGA